MISSFRGEYAFLSNFYPAELIDPYGQTFPTLEHAFQAAKTTDWGERQAIREAATPTLAKRLGRRCQLVEDWERVKIPAMRQLLALKFAPGTYLASSLLATEPHVLIEGNTWGDRFWGQCYGAGENWLGHLLMARRAELGE